MKEKTEEWRVFPLFNGNYEVSNLGRVRSIDKIVRKFSVLVGMDVDQFYKGKILKQSKADKYGHLSVHIGFEKKRYKIPVHQMVLIAFTCDRPEGMVACHNNGDAADNRVENLRWDTQAENNADRKRHNRYANCENHPMAKLTRKQALEIIGCSKTITQISKEYGISQSHAWRLKRGESWKNA